MDLILYLAIFFLVTSIIGRLLEKLRIPWIFSALFIGVVFSFNNPFSDVTSSQSFGFLAQLGLYFMLFIIGFEMNIKKIKQQRTFIMKTTAIIIFAEAFFGSLIMHFIFGLSWFVATIIALSFATVGEAMLLPILDEFKLTKTKLGQTILGIGALDDLAEIYTIVIVGILVGTGEINPHLSITLITILFIMAYMLTKLKEEGHHMKFGGYDSLFLIVLFFIFLFVGIGELVDAAALGALLSGIALKTFIPPQRLKMIDSEIRTMAYGFFAPIFFLSIGLDTHFEYLTSTLLMILLIVAVTNATKIISSYLVGKKSLGTKKSIFMGISLSVKFSTSLVIIKLLFENNIITSYLYTVLIGSTILFEFVIPPLLAYFAKKWEKELLS